MRAVTLALCALPGALLFGAACSKLVGIDDVTLRDAAPPVDDGVIDAPPNTVTGKSFTRYRTPAGQHDVPNDLSAGVIKALIVDTTQPSGYRSVTGTGRADGTFTISDVTDGAPYLLRINSNYYALTRHVVEERVDHAVRRVPPPAQRTGQTTVGFNVTGMAPFLNGPEGTFSFIEIDSINLGFQGTISALPNNTATLARQFDWSLGTNFVDDTEPLADSTQGDDLTLVHMRNDLVLNATTGRLKRIAKIRDTFTPNNVVIANGAATPVAGAWVAAATNRSINLAIARGAFDSGYDQNTQFLNMSVSLTANPIAGTQLGATLFNVDLFDWSRSGALNDTTALMYADPFPTTWARTLIISYARGRSMRLPNIAGTLTIPGVNLRAIPYAGGDPVTAPALQPPSGLRVVGKDAILGGTATFDGTAPVELMWNAVGSAKTYQVRVDRVFSNGTQTVRELLATLTTAATSIKIPAEVFTGGPFFVFTVTAVSSPSDYDGGQLISNGLPFSSAATVSNMFRLGVLCGNGQVDPGEACDTGGETAQCDADCTPVLCGDGYRNAVTETCDTVRNTPGCDSDCTAVMCGDNRVNTAVEDCEDGNPADTGNGCSASCKLNGVCGDGIQQAVDEDCDPGPGGGDSANCDFDCSARVCGDGHRNAAANEVCDDGNGDNTDGCTTACQAN